MQSLQSLTFEIGICAYNEGQNIGRLLRKALYSYPHNSVFDAITVVSSGSTDKTNNEVQSIAKKDPRINLITEPERLGKSHAVNQILTRSKSDVIILMSADILLTEDTLSRLLDPFKTENVGLTGCRVEPVNGIHSACGNVVRLIWSLHDKISEIDPKFGEILAFKRQAVPFIEPEIITDEAFIEMKVKTLGLETKYIRETKVLNRGPETIGELLEQRRRVFLGHLQLRQKYGYSVSTTKFRNLLSVLTRSRRSTKFRYLALAVSLEVLARVWASISFLAGKKASAWKILESTKRLSED